MMYSTPKFLLSVSLITIKVFFSNVSLHNDLTTEVPNVILEKKFGLVGLL